ncbi:MAG: peptidoglycan-binding protein [Ruminococcus sp.]|jgi:hypothetical protein|nr:peptidoglycan-binding protein [Ruminococcus sp.]
MGNLSPHFNKSEFYCKCGKCNSGEMKKDIVDYLEKLRSALGSDKCIINSGYRCAAYNKKIGGSTGSKHCQGMAADVRFYKGASVINAKAVCVMAQKLNIFGGIAYISDTATHLDCRQPVHSYIGDEKGGYSNNVTGKNFYSYKDFGKVFDSLYPSADKPVSNPTSSDKPISNPYPKPNRTIKSGCKGNDVKWCQKQIVDKFKISISVDGIFGAKTTAAVKTIQKSKNLAVDGIIGAKTLKILE